MSAFKIINDPIYGFIQIPRGIILELIDHPWYQRLRRIRQGGFSHLVYPGATHTRFHHSLGAYHLATRTIRVLRDKKVEISDAEAEALSIALLLHDIGHGPFSHSLEHMIVDVHHEEMTRRYLHALNAEFDGALTMAISMFNGDYERPFFHQLVSGALDLDRMDYLARDSYYTGVSEGVIGYDRLIHMFYVVEDELVVEEKGLTSVDKFVLARQLMYRQVYFHKMVASSECMLRRAFGIIHRLLIKGEDLPDLPIVDLLRERSALDAQKLLERFSLLDDSDVLMLLKGLLKHTNHSLRILSEGLIHRHLFTYKAIDYVDERDLEEYVRLYTERFGQDLVIVASESVKTSRSDSTVQGIQVLMKDGQVKDYNELTRQVPSKALSKAYLSVPKTEGNER